MTGAKTSGSHRGRPWRAGFTLVEIVVASAIIGMVVIALYSGITSCLFRIRMARENLRATQVMLEKVEIIRLLTWSQINTPGFIPAKFSASYDADTTNTSQGLIYSGTITITNVNLPVNYQGDLREVIVQLTWNTDRLQRTREMRTLFSRNGVQNYMLQ